MALVELDSNKEARRLQNQGFSRTGSKSIETNFQNLEKILDIEHVSVQKIVLHRENGEEEAEVVDHFLNKEPELRENYRFDDRDGLEQVSGFRKKFPGKMSAQTDIVLRIYTSKLPIYRQFRKVLNKDDPEKVPVPESEFQEKKEEAVEAAEEKLQEKKKELDKQQQILDETRSKELEDFQK